MSETGLSDFHKRNITVLKTYFQKQSPIRIKYRNYKKLDDTSFRYELLNKLDTINLILHTVISIMLLCLP